MLFDKIKKGRRGEKEAGRFLRKRGFRILEKNYRTRFGEIDIIALDGDTVVFVEVKTRHGDSFGAPGEAVDSRKRLHMTRAASSYLKAKGIEDRQARFDVLALVFKDGRYEMEHIRDAFEASSI